MNGSRLKYVLGLSLIVLTLTVARSVGPEKETSFHSEEEMALFMAQTTDLPIDTNNYFATSGAVSYTHLTLPTTSRV